MLALLERAYLIQCYVTNDLCYREVINKFNEKYPKKTISYVAVRKLVKKLVETGSIRNVKNIRKHLDENDTASVLVFHSLEENPEMLRRNRALQSGIKFIIANNKQTRFHKNKLISLKFCMVPRFYIIS
jgi:tRNA-dihydrouridine synthase